MEGIEVAYALEGTYGVIPVRLRDRAGSREFLLKTWPERAGFRCQGPSKSLLEDLSSSG